MPKTVRTSVTSNGKRIPRRQQTERVKRSGEARQWGSIFEQGVELYGPVEMTDEAIIESGLDRYPKLVGAIRSGKLRLSNVSMHHLLRRYKGKEGK